MELIEAFQMMERTFEEGKTYRLTRIQDSIAVEEVVEAHKVSTQAGYVKIVKNTLTGEHRYLLMGDNHEPLLHSEYFTRKSDMMDTIRKYFGEWAIADASGS